MYSQVFSSSPRVMSLCIVPSHVLLAVFLSRLPLDWRLRVDLDSGAPRHNKCNIMSMLTFWDRLNILKLLPSVCLKISHCQYAWPVKDGPNKVWLHYVLVFSTDQLERHAEFWCMLSINVDLKARMCRGPEFSCPIQMDSGLWIPQALILESSDSLETY